MITLRQINRGSVSKPTLENKQRDALLPAKKLSEMEVTSLYEKHSPALAAYPCCCGLDFASAEDVVQQLFLRLLRGDLISPDKPLAYLYRAVRNSTMNWRRARRSEVEMPTEGCWLVHSGGKTEEVMALQEALRKLPEEQRDVLFLRLWGGMTFEEIAEFTDSGINTVASRYRYALEKLRGQMKPWVRTA